LIEREVQIAAALEAGFLNDPAITAALENLMINKLRSEQLDKLLSEVIIPQIEIDQYYQQNIQKYTTPAMTRLAIIRLSLSSQASADKRSAVKGQAEQVYKLAFTLPDSINGFGSLAAKYSDHQASRYAGGDMGWIKNDAENGQVDNAILKALAQLELNGDLAPVIEGTAGFYLVKLLDRRTETVKSLQKVGSNIQRLLEREKRQQVEADWLLALQNNGQPLVINQDALAAITVPINAESSSKQIVPPLLPGK
jgi:parvulin-like peptidyl-prolyl isomerase